MTKFLSMTSRRTNNRNLTDGPAIFDQYDDDVESMRGSVAVLNQVTKAISEELDNQNILIGEMSNRYQKGVDGVSKLLGNVKQLFKSSGMSPMTMMMIFIFLLVIFFWFYWKCFA